MASLGELAEHLGLSTATVSRALNDQPGVGAETRRRVLDAAAEFGFSFNNSARTLATARTENIGFVLYNRPIISDPFYSQVMAGVERECAGRGYHLFLSVLDDKQVADPQSLSLTRTRRVDGLVLAGPDIPARFILALRAQGVPLVLLDNALVETPLDCVLNDDAGGAAAATRHLLEHGHRRIACLCGPRAWASSRERYDGYRHVMEDAQLAPLAVHVGETTRDSGRAAMQQLLDRGEDVTAVFAINDAMALGAFEALEAAGRRVPDDVALIGFDDLAWTELHRPSFTTVHSYKRQMGRMAVARLFELLADGESQPARILVATQLIRRRSCGCDGAGLALA